MVCPTGINRNMRCIENYFRVWESKLTYNYNLLDANSIKWRSAYLSFNGMCHNIGKDIKRNVTEQKIDDLKF